VAAGCAKKEGGWGAWGEKKKGMRRRIFRQKKKKKRVLLYFAARPWQEKKKGGGQGKRGEYSHRISISISRREKERNARRARAAGGKGNRGDCKTTLREEKGGRRGLFFQLKMRQKKMGTG